MQIHIRSMHYIIEQYENFRSMHSPNIKRYLKLQHILISYNTFYNLYS